MCEIFFTTRRNGFVSIFCIVPPAKIHISQVKVNTMNIRFCKLPNQKCLNSSELSVEDSYKVFV